MPLAASYAARQPPAEKGEDPVTVLVTGFGPFLSKFPKNSSWEIASTLPALVPASPNSRTPIHIHVHHEAIRVAYNYVNALIPKLLPPNNPLYPKPEIILHIGLAAGRNYYTLEQGAHRRGYDKIPDVDGERWSDSKAESSFPTSKFPPVLETTFDTSDILARWKANLSCSTVDGIAKTESIPDVRISPDAGNYLCGFTYYNSLAHCFSIKEDERPVVFLHVPDLSSSERKLSEGWEVAVALIKALVDSKRKIGTASGIKDQENGKETGEKDVAQMDNNFT